MGNRHTWEPPFGLSGWYFYPSGFDFLFFEEHKTGHAMDWFSHMRLFQNFSFWNSLLHIYKNFQGEIFNARRLWRFFVSIHS
jgi:hypothetical protein